MGLESGWGCGSKKAILKNDGKKTTDFFLTFLILVYIYENEDSSMGNAHVLDYDKRSFARQMDLESQSAERLAGTGLVQLVFDHLFGGFTAHNLLQKTLSLASLANKIDETTKCKVTIFGHEGPYPFRKTEGTRMGRFFPHWPRKANATSIREKARGDYLAALKARREDWVGLGSKRIG